MHDIAARNYDELDMRKKLLKNWRGGSSAHANSAAPESQELCAEHVEGRLRLNKSFRFSEERPTDLLVLLGLGARNTN